MKKTIKTISLVAALISLMSCGDSGKTSNEIAADSVKTTENIDTAKITTMYNIPSPIETFTILKLSGATFDKSYLNPSKNIAKYVSNFSKSINLGTYSADLSFCLMYKENSGVDFYLKNVNDLTAALGIEGGFAESVTKRLKANANNSDSLMAIVSEASVDAYLYLKENQRGSTSALMTAGGWIEGMYFITSMANKTPNSEINRLIANQKKVLRNLTRMLQKFGTAPEEANLLTEIKDISAVYDNLQPAKEVTAAATDKDAKDKNIVSVGNNKSFDLTDEQLKTITGKVEALRNKLIN